MYLSHVSKFVFFRHIPDYWYCIYCYDWICAFWETTPTCGSYCISCLFYDFLSFRQRKGNTTQCVCLCAFSSSLVSNGTMSRLSKLIIFILYLYFILCILYSINIHVFHDDTDFSLITVNQRACYALMILNRTKSITLLSVDNVLRVCRCLGIWTRCQDCKCSQCDNKLLQWKL